MQILSFKQEERVLVLMLWELVLLGSGLGWKVPSASSLSHPGTGALLGTCGYVCSPFRAISNPDIWMGWGVGRVCQGAWMLSRAGSYPSA